MPTLYLTGYLVLHKTKQGTLSARFVTKRPALRSGEISVELKATVPSQLFERPTVVFELNVPEGAVGPRTVSAEVVGQLEGLIESNLGLSVQFVGPEPNSQGL